jgi:hypothetical protein
MKDMTQVALYEEGLTKYEDMIEYKQSEGEMIPPQQFTMCEVCGEREAEEGDFTCMECYSRLLVEQDK